MDVPLVGRDGELAGLTDRLACARAGRSQVVVVEGEAGTGKSALLDAFLDRAEAGVVLRASGEEAEELVSYGIVEQLVRGALRRGHDGPGAELRPADEPAVVGTALVALLDRVGSGDAPVVVLVDDAHWADARSLQALVFALRRLGTDRVLTVVAARPHEDGRLDRLRALASGGRGAVLRLGGLGVTALVELGRALGAGSLPLPAAQRLLAHTGGIPLHARALFEEVDPAVLRSVEVALPSPVSYAVLVMGRLSQCPAATRTVVAAAAVLGERCRLVDAVTLAGAVDDGVPGAGAVGPAVDARLLVVDEAVGGPVLRFPHALIRAAVRHDLDIVARAALHAAAARIVESPDEVLRHRVAAALAPDPALAAELDALAAQQVGRGEQSRAAATLISAAGLHPGAADRRRSLVDAVELLVLAGEGARATGLMAGLGPGPVAPRESYVRGLVEFTAGHPAEAERLLLAAWAEGADPDPALRSVIGDRLCHLYYLQLRTAESVEWGRRALAADPRHTGSVVTGMALAGAPITAPAEGAGPEPALTSGARSLWTEDLDTARLRLREAVVTLRGSGMFLASLHAQGYLALAEHRLADWDAAVADAEEVVALAQDAEQDWTLARLHSYAAMPHAARGDFDRADAHVAAATAAAAATGLPLDRVGATVAAANVADSRGDHGTVVELLDPLARRTVGGVGEPGVSTWPCLLADALVHQGRTADADRVLAPYERRAAELGRRIAQATAARTRGRLRAACGDPDAAERSFRDAAAHARDAGAEFDGALTALAHGALLRRAGRRRAAATELGAARTVLARLGARPALARCDQELAVCGLAPVRRAAPAHRALTPRESGVARMVASGMSTPQVAAELIVSVNTVEFHLRNVYAKLGIRSRAELRARLD
jgi:DNA-binding CsgD family transcriptional regulator/tetratricopeptide (TPR) repeat protein